MNFEADIRNEVLRALPYDRTDVGLVTVLTGSSTRELVIRMYNWLGRLVHPHPRKVYRSKDFIFQPLSSGLQVDVEALVLRIEQGHDLRRHLSKRIASGFQSVPGPKNLRKRRDLDLLLNEWGIHHLHPSQVLMPNGHVQQSNELVFIAFREEAAFLINVGTHKQFEDQALIETLHRNWPTADFLRQLNVAGMSNSVASNDRKALRSGGVASFVQIDAKVYMPSGGGISTAGTANSIMSMNTIIVLRDLEYKLEAYKHHLDSYVEKCGVTCPPHPVYRVVLSDYPTKSDFAVLEETSGAISGIR